MSREIKFRAWDTIYKKWYTRVQVGTDCCNSVYDDEREMWLEFDKFCGVVVQFTGLHDKNGKEIYEGDVLSHWWSGRRKDTVDFKNGGYYAGVYPLGSCTDDKEIIGNIYEEVNTDENKSSIKHHTDEQQEEKEADKG